MSEIKNQNDEFELTEEQEKQISGGSLTFGDIEVVFKCTNPSCRKRSTVRLPQYRKVNTINCKYCSYQYKVSYAHKTLTDKDGNNALISRWCDWE